MFYQSLSNVICVHEHSLSSHLFDHYIILKVWEAIFFGANAVGKQNERESNEIL